MPIRVLPETLASQIAAGEVVERPASVIKELVENALDAHARTVTAEVEEGGRRKIRVSDDGDGIPPGEIELALLRHATSKIATVEELERIRTLGFRGEALASIAAVSRLTLLSRAKGEGQGMSLKVAGGKRTGAPKPAGAPQGTSILVEDLFYNVPARLKFLKSESTEKQQIDRLMARYALAYPDVRFRLVQDGREALQSSGSGNRREALAQVFGLESAEKMLGLSDPLGPAGVSVTGFISPADISRSNRRDILLFVNGRPIADASLTTAVVQAYHTLLMVGRYPAAAIFIDLPPDQVDVNVHPAKAEVRLRAPDAVFSAVQRSVRQALMAQSPVPEVRPPAAWPGAGANAGRETLPAPDWMLDHGSAPMPMAAAPVMPATRPMDAAGSIPLLRVLGQIGASYLVAEGPDGLYLIDQHAAHERVLFEALSSQAGPAETQALLNPEVVELPPAEARLLAGELDSLAHVGFEVEPFGGSAFRVRAMPYLLRKLSPAEALRAAVEDIAEDESPLAAASEEKLIARICKRAAVKAGQALGPEEQAALVRALEQCASPRTCPHGRPTMIHLPVALLERQFGRRG